MFGDDDIQNYVHSNIWRCVNCRWKPRNQMVINFGSIPACDKRTNERTDRQTDAALAKSRISMA